MDNTITIIGARQHNLKNISLEIPRNKLVVVTGLSGSGKSSLAFDTLYAEGQRRYVESLSAYARQFLDQLQKPDVDHIEGLSPAIAIEQRTGAGNPRSIVATTTEIHDYLRLLYAHVGTPHCPKCAKPVFRQTAQDIVSTLQQIEEGKKLMVLSPYIRGRKGEHKEVLEKMRKDGFVRARIDGEIRALDEDISLAKTKKHTLEVLVDRLVAGRTSTSRMTDSVELALRLGDGLLVLLVEDESAKTGWREETLSEHLACLPCGVSFEELLPRHFSFNSPYGACPACNGLGSRLVFNEELVIAHPELSLIRGAAPLWRRGPHRLIKYYNHLLRRVAEHYEIKATTPWDKLTREMQMIYLWGSGDEDICFDFWMRGKMHKMTKPFEGIIDMMARRYRETESEDVRERFKVAMEFTRCETCKGRRLRPESLAVTVDGVAINEFCAMSVDKSVAFSETLDESLTGAQRIIAKDIIKEIRQRLGFLKEVGLGYLTLDRHSGTLSGGEAQRIRLATQLGSGLVGVMYILDEPSIGLHQRDNDRLLSTLKKLRDQGNTVIVVEHDLETIQAADIVIDLGPGAGRHGGELVCIGTPEEVAQCPESRTGHYLNGDRAIDIPETRHPGNGNELVIRGARQHNLKNIDVTLPLGTFCCVTGVSGSGKSTLIREILLKALKFRDGIRGVTPGDHDRIDGLEHVEKTIIIDQSPIGRTPRSNPATYTNAFTQIRSLFSQVPESRVRGYKPGRFSFNVKGGRCEACKGDGIRQIEMQFLPNVYVECEVCKGRRYNEETLAIRYKGRSIADVLDMTVSEACEFFDAVPRLQRILHTLEAVGMGYVHLGQSATTLSGGEAQRVKLSSELAKKTKGHTLYVLDEPTTGLHLADIHQLLDVLVSLRDQGNTVLVIEHNLDVIKMADHLVDLGLEGGDKGGSVIATGTPEEVARCRLSHTARYLRPILGIEKASEPTKKPTKKTRKKGTGK